MTKKSKKMIEYRVYHLLVHFPVLLLDGDEWRISDVMSNRLHFHNCLEIGICHTDSGTLAFEDETQFYRAGDISYIPRHILHTTCSTKGVKSRWSYLFMDLEEFLFDVLPEFGPGAQQLRSPQSHYLLNKDQHPRIHFLITAIIDEMKEKRTHYMSIVKSLCHVLYFDLLRLEMDNPTVPEKTEKSAFALKPALEFIHEQYAQPITVEMLAEMCHLSEPHFRKRFVSILGTSPINFLNTTRINQACILLVTSEKPILSIAEEVGFSSISNFNRCFQQIMGVSPKAYRKPSVREGIEPKRKYVLQYKGWMTPDVQPEFVDDEYMPQ